MADPGAKTRLFELIREKVLAADPEYRLFGHNTVVFGTEGMADFLLCGPGDLQIPDQAFERMRWGGVVIVVSHDQSEVRKLHEVFAERREYRIERTPTPISVGLVPGFKKNFYYFTARKVFIVRPGEFSDRFTNHVELIPDANEENGYAVLKVVPEQKQMEQRLAMRFPDLDREDVAERARTFTHNVFPLFLTRETGILKVLEKYLPEQYKHRVPRVISHEKNESGYVTKFAMSWLRNSTGGEPPIKQLEFAKQMSDMLRALHDTARVIHLDLRPDNLVITRHGVGFIDFGSSVRIGEDLSKSKVLMKMFEQVMITSQIQRTLGQMSQSGVVTSRVIRDGYRKVDKAVDLFFMTLQMNQPLANPDFKGLIDFTPDSTEAKALSQLTGLILKPREAENPLYQTAADVYRGILQIESHLPELRKVDAAQRDRVEQIDARP